MLQRFIADIRKFFGYAVYSAKAELKAEVASSYLNWVWWVLEPVCFMLIYTLIFGVIFNGSEPNFPIFIYIGLTAWTFFSKNITNSVKMVKNNKATITKVYLPKFILILSKMMVNGFKMLISFAIVLGMMIFFRVSVSYRILLLIPELITMFIVTFGFMTIIMHFGVYIDDLSNIINILLRLLFYMTGIFYNIQKRLSGKAPQWMINVWLKVNPMASIITSMRNSLIYNSWGDWKTLIVWTILGLIISAIGVRMIYRNENGYAKVI